MKFQTIAIHGPSGSGKDTQTDLLQDDHRFVRITASAVMEVLRLEGNEVALQAYEYGKLGQRYPDDLLYVMLGIWLSRIDQSLPWLFVSPVRKYSQIVLIDKLLAKYDRKLEAFIHFKVSEDIVIDRMSLRTYCPKCKRTYHLKYNPPKVEGKCDIDMELLSKRVDDTPEYIARRLEWYNEDILPILGEYSNRGVLYEIDASPSIMEIHTEVLKYLGLNEKHV